MQRMNTLNSALSPIHMKATIPQIDLAPSQGAEFSRPQSMTISEQDRRCIPWPIPSTFACSLDQSINFLLSQ